MWALKRAKKPAKKPLSRGRTSAAKRRRKEAPISGLGIEAEAPERYTAVFDRDSPPRNVLVVEDKDDAAEALRYLLALGGHHVEVARDGRTAVELAQRSSPDIIFCDLGLPDIDGYEVARTLRRDRRLDATALVALSGYARPEDIARCRDAGFDRHLVKPPAPNVLFDLIAMAHEIARA